MKQSVSAESPHPYSAFVLRIWQEPNGDSLRCELRDAHSQVSRGFADSAELLAYLATQLQPARGQAAHCTES